MKDAGPAIKHAGPAIGVAFVAMGALSLGGAALVGHFGHEPPTTATRQVEASKELTLGGITLSEDPFYRAGWNLISTGTILMLLGGLHNSINVIKQPSLAAGQLIGIGLSLLLFATQAPDAKNLLLIATALSLIGQRNHGFNQFNPLHRREFNFTNLIQAIQTYRLHPSRNNRQTVNTELGHLGQFMTGESRYFFSTQPTKELSTALKDKKFSAQRLQGPLAGQAAQLMMLAYLLNTLAIHFPSPMASNLALLVGVSAAAMSTASTLLRGYHYRTRADGMMLILGSLFIILHRGGPGITSDDRHIAGPAQAGGSLGEALLYLGSLLNGKKFAPLRDYLDSWKERALDNLKLTTDDVRRDLGLGTYEPLSQKGRTLQEQIGKRGMKDLNEILARDELSKFPLASVLEAIDINIELQRLKDILSAIPKSSDTSSTIIHNAPKMEQQHLEQISKAQEIQTSLEKSKQDIHTLRKQSITSEQDARQILSEISTSIDQVFAIENFIRNHIIYYDGHSFCRTVCQLLENECFLLESLQAILDASQEPSLKHVSTETQSTLQSSRSALRDLTSRWQINDISNSINLSFLRSDVQRALKNGRQVTIEQINAEQLSRGQPSIDTLLDNPFLRHNYFGPGYNFLFSTKTLEAYDKLEQTASDRLIPDKEHTLYELITKSLNAEALILSTLTRSLNDIYEEDQGLGNSIISKLSRFQKKLSKTLTLFPNEHTATNKILLTVGNATLQELETAARVFDWESLDKAHSNPRELAEQSIKDTSLLIDNCLTVYKRLEAESLYQAQKCSTTPDRNMETIQFEGVIIAEFIERGIDVLIQWKKNRLRERRDDTSAVQLQEIINSYKQQMDEIRITLPKLTRTQLELAA